MSLTWKKVSDDISAILSSINETDRHTYGLHDMNVWLQPTFRVNITDDAPDVKAVLELHAACQSHQALDEIGKKFNAYLDLQEDFSKNGSTSQIGRWVASQTSKKI